jgi:hypothetical protein
MPGALKKKESCISPDFDIQLLEIKLKSNRNTTLKKNELFLYKILSIL